MDEKILSRYSSQVGADSYQGKFERHWRERINDRNEQRLLQKIFTRLSPEKIGTALDVPCGYGRLFPILHTVAPHVVESDYSELMLQNAHRYHEASGAVAAHYVQNNALQLQFNDRSFDMVLSVRLCHHIRDHEERLQYLLEITRVSRCWVIFTYADFASLKNRLREIKRRVSSKRPKWTLKAKEVKETAEAAGFEVVESIPLSRLFSLHRYTILRRKGASS